jgi:dTDP-4-amino-4,6-dideoxygalactose transaminase
MTSTAILSSSLLPEPPLAKNAPLDWRVPMLDPLRIYAPLEEQLSEAFTRVIRSGRYILGPEVANFERDVCDFLEVEHCIGASSGTDALLSTLMALGIGPGDEVVTSAFTFVATADVILRVGALPVFVDVCPSCLCLDPALVESAVGRKTKAILAVDLFGQPGHIEQLQTVARNSGIALIEDACQAFGAKQKGKAAGTFGRVGCFSFFPTKTLGGFGDAGLVATNDSELAERIRTLRTHGTATKYDYNALGGNFRIDALHAALLSVLLPHIGEWLISRRGQALTYSQSLANIPHIYTPGVHAYADPAWSVYTVRVPRNRDALRAYLAKDGIETAIYYPSTLAQQPVFAGVSRVHRELTVATAASCEVLSLPLFPGLRDADQGHVISSIEQFFATFVSKDPSVQNLASDTCARRGSLESVSIDS